MAQQLEEGKIELVIFKEDDCNMLQKNITKIGKSSCFAESVEWEGLEWVLSWKYCNKCWNWLEKRIEKKLCDLKIEFTELSFSPVTASLFVSAAWELFE